MGKPVAWKDEYTLLCERCGYVVEGLATDGACPECGKPIAESLPERRAGTAWQRDPRAANLLRTWAMSLFRPVRTLDVLAERPATDTRLRRWTLLASALLLSIGYWQYGAVDVIREKPVSAVVLVVFILACTLAVWPVLLGLTLVETWGLSVIAKTRRFRVPLNARRAITAHGCVGWLLAGVSLCLVTAGLDVLHAVFTEPPVKYDPSLSPSENFAVIFAPRTPLWLDLLSFLTRVICVLTGFLFFETFAWLGLRRLKYANRVRPEPSGEPAGVQPPAPPQPAPATPGAGPDGLPRIHQ